MTVTDLESIPTTDTDPDGPAVASPEPEPGAEEKVGPQARQYLVLMQDNDASRWITLGWTSAGTAEQAIRHTITEKKIEGGGVFVAVPQKSWRPAKFETHQPPPVIRSQPV